MLENALSSPGAYESILGCRYSIHYTNFLDCESLVFFKVHLDHLVGNVDAYLFPQITGEVTILSLQELPESA